jgi:hypothetical protein
VALASASELRLDRVILAIVWALRRALRGLFRARLQNALELLALQQQTAIYKRRFPRPRLDAFDRTFCVLLGRTWSRWKAFAAIAKPASVLFREQLLDHFGIVNVRHLVPSPRKRSAPSFTAGHFYS